MVAKLFLEWFENKKYKIQFIMNKKIVVIGSTNIDITMQLEHLPKMGETVTNGEYYQAFGGKGANQAVGAARSGGNVVFVTCLGDDNFSAILLESFIKDNIQTNYVFIETGVTTGSALIMTDSQGRNCIGVASGANENLSPSMIDKALLSIKEAEIILLQCEIPQHTNEYVIDLGQKLNKKVILNLAPARPIEDLFLAKLYLLVVNETEAEFISDRKVTSSAGIEKAADAILKKGLKNLIITLGERGSYVACEGKRYFVQAPKVESVDSTAAGDVYCGALAVALNEGKSFENAVKFATAAASICVTRLGAQPSAPKRIEIDEFLNKVK
jgi:ribokinase